jgi:hypothetical protein
MHPTIAQALAPFAPANSTVHTADNLNDDDLYICDILTKRIVSHYGCSSVSAAQARMSGLTVKPGQALLTGLQARSFGAKT